MKRLSIVLAMVPGILAIVGLTGCQTTAVQAVRLSGQTNLVVSVEGAETQPEPLMLSGKSGEPIHRVLRSPDGTVLFAYDLYASPAGPDGQYHFVLKPAAAGPTFDESRDVTALAHEQVRVELMEDPGTGRKIVDVLALAKPEMDPGTAIHQHLLHIHNAIWQWVHGS